jgi:putative transposase
MRFVLHSNTVRSWIKAIEGRGNARLLMPAVVWNRIDDMVRWAVHELRRLCPEPEFGTRSIARHLMRAGIAVSRTTVQNVLREPTPRKTRIRPSAVAAGIDPHHVLTPGAPDTVWHLDLTTLRVLWRRFTVAAVLDGFTRRILALRVYGRVPRAVTMAALVRRLARQGSAPDFIITDHGSQFRPAFGRAVKRMGTHHIQSQVGQPFLNGKIERLFRSLRAWWRFVLPCLTVRGLQKRLDTFAAWYNDHRVHAAHGSRTPSEVDRGIESLDAVPIRQRDDRLVSIPIKRHACCGDPRLPIIDTRVHRHAA